ncbi:MAG: hypothetical protein ACOY81_09000 [Bacillota bacterium]
MGSRSDRLKAEAARLAAAQTERQQWQRHLADLRRQTALLLQRATQERQAKHLCCQRELLAYTQQLLKNEAARREAARQLARQRAAEQQSLVQLTSSYLHQCRQQHRQMAAALHSRLQSYHMELHLQGKENTQRIRSYLQQLLG